MMFSMYPNFAALFFSVRCFRCLLGCSFIAGNKGSFLTFPKSILPVDDFSDCTISGSLMDISTNGHFDSHLVGSICVVSDKTKFKQQRHTVSNVTKNPRQLLIQASHLHQYHHLQHGTYKLFLLFLKPLIVLHHILMLYLFTRLVLYQKILILILLHLRLKYMKLLLPSYVIYKNMENLY